MIAVEVILADDVGCIDDYAGGIFGLALYTLLRAGGCGEDDKAAGEVEDSFHAELI